MPWAIRVELSPLDSAFGEPGQKIADGATLSLKTLGVMGSKLKLDTPTPAKLSFDIRLIQRARTPLEGEESRPLATLEGTLLATRGAGRTLRFTGKLGDDDKPVGLVSAKEEPADGATSEDEDEDEGTEIRLLRFAFDAEQFDQISVSDEPTVLRVRLNPRRFRYFDVVATLEIDGEKEAESVNDVLGVLVTTKNPAPVPAETRRARLVGMTFDADKCFPLPEALPGIRLIVALHQEYPDRKIAVVGHSESDEVTAGPDLAVTRAEIMAAYLTGNSKPFLPWFAAAKPRRARWGTREVQLMLGAIVEGGGPFYAGYASGVTDDDTKAGVRKFQTWKGLKVDGAVGPKTRQALVDAYLAVEGTTLGAGAAVATYGCQGHADDTLTAAGLQVDDRRIEAFFFDGPMKPKPSKNPTRRGATEYPAWCARLVETRDFEVHGIHAQIVDVKARPVPEAEVELSGPTSASGVADAHGVVSFFGLKSGEYTISAQRAGYKIASQTLIYPTAKTVEGIVKTAAKS